MAFGKYGILAEGSILHRGRSAADMVSVGNSLTVHSHHLEPTGLVRSGWLVIIGLWIMLIKRLGWH